MCQNLDGVEEALEQAIALLHQVQKQIQKKESKIKKEKDIVKNTSKNIIKSKSNNIYDNVFYIINHYQKYHPKAMRSVKKNSGIFKKIEGRLIEGYSVQELCNAIDGQHQSPFHLGDNKNQTQYLQLELVVRSGEKVDMFLEIFDRPKTSPLKPKTARSVRAAQEWLMDDEDLQGMPENQGSERVPSQPVTTGWAAK